jgi:hypothetical protein
MRYQGRVSAGHRLHVQPVLGAGAVDPVGELAPVGVRDEGDASGEGVQDVTRLSVRDDELLFRAVQTVVHRASVRQPDGCLEPAGFVVELVKLLVDVGDTQLRRADMDEQLRSVGRPGQVEGTAAADRHVVGRGHHVLDDAHPQPLVGVAEVRDVGRGRVPLQEERDDPHRNRLQPLPRPRRDHDARLPAVDLDPRDRTAVGRCDRLIDLDVGPGVGRDRYDVRAVRRHRPEVPIVSEHDEAVGGVDRG